MTPKIYVVVTARFPHTGDVGGAALAEDGCVLAEHLSSNEEWLKSDLGIGSECKHDRYQRHYPGGYELEWIEGNSSHAGYQAALKAHYALRAESDRKKPI